MDEPFKKSDFISARVTPVQNKHIRAHLGRLGVSAGERILELIRRDIIAHNHFDLSIEVGPTRRPKGMRAAA